MLTTKGHVHLAFPTSKWNAISSNVAIRLIHLRLDASWRGSCWLIQTSSRRTVVIRLTQSHLYLKRFFYPNRVLSFSFFHCQFVFCAALVKAEKLHFRKTSAHCQLEWDVIPNPEFRRTSSVRPNVTAGLTSSA